LVFEENIGNLRFQSIIELTCYRIINELINNTLKYAQAKTIKTSIKFTDKILYIAYQDDGIGFEYEELMKREHKGMCLLNIINRLSVLKANYNIQTKPNQGFMFEMKLVIDKTANDENSNCNS
jgi:signal transduction histidine kinase